MTGNLQKKVCWTNEFRGQNPEERKIVQNCRTLETQGFGLLPLDETCVICPDGTVFKPSTLLEYAQKIKSGIKELNDEILEKALTYYMGYQTI